MNILAIEASSDACSCALLVGEILIERHQVAPRAHTDLLLPAVGDVLAEATLQQGDVQRLAYGAGPGSFTGVRIAASVAQGLALASGVPVTPVSSLAALAMRGGRAGEVVAACLDARMGEVYLGMFRLDAQGMPEALGAELLCAPEDAGPAALPVDCAVGSGWSRYAEVLHGVLGTPARLMADLHPGAAEVARLAAVSPVALDPTEAGPVYLRREVATPPSSGALS